MPNDPERLIRDAIDVLAMGYPVGGSEAERAAYMDEMRRALEERAPVVRARMRAAMRGG